MVREKGPPKRKRRRIALIVLGVLVVIGLILHWPTETGFTISRETTYITGPVNPDGTINYVAALNEMMSKGVTPENNAAVLLIRAFGPDVFDKSIREKLLVKVGIADLPTDAQYFQHFRDYVESATADADPSDSADAEVEVLAELPKGVCTGPWGAEQHPRVAGWLKANEAPLSLVVEASRRPRYYLPRVSPSLTPRLMETLTWFPPYLRLAEALSARAMLRFHDGDVNAAMRDILAAHRLARLLAQQPLLIDRLVALVVGEVAARSSATLATRGHLTKTQAQRLSADLEALAPVPGITDAFHQGERVLQLDFVMGMYSGETTEALELPEAARGLTRGAVDWDHMLRSFNHWMDRVVDVAGRANPRERGEGAAALIRDVEQLKTRHDGLARVEVTLAPLLGRLGRRIPANLIVNWAVISTIPMFCRTMDAPDKLRMRLEVAKLAASLAAFKAERGRFPAKLAELSPAYIKAIPQDSFTNKPLIYKRAGKGYVLYSVGPNMTDDGGQEDEDAGKDDVAVRVK